MCGALSLLYSFKHTMFLVLLGNALCNNCSTIESNKENDTIDCFSTFEVGSTSALPTEHHNPNTTTIGLATLTHQWHTQKTISPKTKGTC
ncbi:hypothetical protein P3L10_010349 [Capsicum annuum]